MLGEKQPKVDEVVSNQVELKVGYWIPLNTPTKIQLGGTKFNSVGIYGTPEIYDQETDKYVHSFFHITDTGDVYMIANSRKKPVAQKPQFDARTVKQKASRVGINGKIIIAPTPESGSPTYLRQSDTLSFTKLAPPTPPVSPPMR